MSYRPYSGQQGCIRGGHRTLYRIDVVTAPTKVRILAQFFRDYDLVPSEPMSFGLTSSIDCGPQTQRFLLAPLIVST